MISIWKLIYELEHWLQIGTGDDIVNCPDNRPEYSHLVEKCKSEKIPNEKIPSKVLLALKEESALPFWKSPTFWHLVFVSIRKVWGR